MKLGAKELRELDENSLINPLMRFPVYLILDNIYDTYNIGGLFRLSDALSIRKLFICGESETPPNNRIKKASVGTYKVVPWEYRESAELTIGELRKKVSGITIASIEQDKRAITYTSHSYTTPIALVVGNETEGISKKVLEISDVVLSIPMWGINKSLNVIVSAGIVLYHTYGTVLKKNT